MFDRVNRGFIDVYDILAGFDLFGIRGTLKEAENFLKRHDLDLDGYLNFSEFTYAVAPLSGTHFDLLQERLSANLSLAHIHWEQIFTHETKSLIRELFSVYLHTETQLSLLREELITFAHHDAFLLLDQNTDGLVTKKNIQNYIKRHYKINLEEKDAEILIHRIDKNRLGKINYQDFAHDLAPSA